MADQTNTGVPAHGSLIPESAATARPAAPQTTPPAKRSLIASINDVEVGTLDADNDIWAFTYLPAWRRARRQLCAESGVATHR